MNKLYLIIGLVILFGLGGAGYYAMTQQQAPVNSSPVKEMSTSVSSIPSSEAVTKDVKEITIEAGSFYYKPNTITVKKGEKVKIVMNSVSMMHDFNIDELNVKMPIVKNGETGTVEFIADKIGTFEYYCSVGQHRANGQVGKITVE